MARFESTLDCPASFEMDVQAPHSLVDSVNSTTSISAPVAVPLISHVKAAEPSPSRFAPWLLSIAYPLGRFGLFPAYFGQVVMTGQENLPRSGPVILAPTHRSRWDALVVPFAAGHHVTGRHLRFMVSADEVTGLQGWFIRRMGGFPINTNRPAIASLRHGVELLEQGETLVIFPEGNIFREPCIQPLKPGLARLAIQAETSRPHLGVKIVPMRIQYSNPLVPWRTKVEVHIGAPIAVEAFCTGRAKQDARSLTVALQNAMSSLI
ncbi:MAG: lysophospholipid acyltransferase family protein [Leptolyngbyaceae cyanobacterium bins.302]|nr:lysophospholipid acyltransferase family protein [Leptolyngbyaceae cyanobacterium bins.302]